MTMPLASPSTTRPRLAVRGGLTREEWSVGAKFTLALYDGPVLELELDLLPCWCRLRFRLWYSAAMEQRVWDRWMAESLAGEHPGVTVSITEPPTA